MALSSLVETTPREPRTPGVEESLPDSAYAHILSEMDDDRRRLRWAYAGAIVFHIVLFFVQLPHWIHPMEVSPAPKQRTYVVHQVRFRPPVAAPQRTVPEKKKRKIPVPDPTPNDPEPIRDLTQDLPEVDYDLPLGDLNLEIPGPPGPGVGPVLEVGGDIQAPVRAFDPRPTYTEEARQARIQGVVLLQAVIDTEGNVADLKVLKPLPLGLDKSAVETVKTWKFKPATRAGVPVAVYYNLTINFSLQ